MSDANNAYMSPDDSPGELTASPGVRRVNRLPLIIAGSLALVFAGVVGVVAVQRAQPKPVEEKSEPAQNEGAAMMTANIARTIIGDNGTGMIAASAPTAPEGGTLADDKSVIGSATPPITPATGTLVPPLRPMASSGGMGGMGGNQNTPDLGPARDPNQERIEQMRLTQYQNALNSKPVVAFQVNRSAMPAMDPASAVPPSTPEEALARLAAIRQQADSGNYSNPNAAYQAKMAAIQQAQGNGGQSGVQGASALTGPTMKNDVSQFANAGKEDRWKSDAKMEKARSPYEASTGWLIPAQLEGGINSELPGNIIARVRQNVYDTATGRNLLFPQGALLFGTYSSSVVFGQARVLVGWQRVVFPNGCRADIGSMPGNDVAGYGGFSDQVNNHYARIFGSALLMSGIVAGVAYSSNRDQTATGTVAAPTVGSALAQGLGQQLGQVSSQLISKNLSIAPTLEIRPGYPFNIVVVKDLAFDRPYREKDECNS